MNPLLEFLIANLLPLFDRGFRIVDSRVGYRFATLTFVRDAVTLELINENGEFMSYTHLGDPREKVQAGVLRWVLADDRDALDLLDSNTARLLLDDLESLTQRLEGGQSPRELSSALALARGIRADQRFGRVAPSANE